MLRKHYICLVESPPSNVHYHSAGAPVLTTNKTRMHQLFPPLLLLLIHIHKRHEALCSVPLCSCHPSHHLLLLSIAHSQAHQRRMKAGKCILCVGKWCPSLCFIICPCLVHIHHTHSQGRSSYYVHGLIGWRQIHLWFGKQRAPNCKLELQFKYFLPKFFPWIQQIDF